ncbi:hypothetical protein [Pseudokineococcus sp. 1T1Z-3]|uniref:hypothetical protein n=1 Tax=Pseudokineococcus sp. 1T1Z-3 TaxID=3132745 RepID=UPI0030A7E925
MHRTTSRGTASTGLVALAAVTALALAVPSAAADTTGTVVLDPAADELDLSLVPVPADPALLQSGFIPAPASAAAVSVTLSDAVVAPATLTAFAVGSDQADALASGGSATGPEVPVTVGDSGLVLDVTPEVAALDPDGEVVVVVDGLESSDLPGAPVTTVLPLDVVDGAAPVSLTGQLVAASLGEEPLTATAGTAFSVEVPAEGSFATLGLSTLLAEGVLLVPADDQLSGGELDQEELLELTEDFLGNATVEVAPGGGSATVTPSADLEAGDYLLVVSLLPEDLATLPSVTGAALVPVDLVAAPAPPAQPAPRDPAPQNPGLRSNTGVEGGGVDGGLVATGAGLLVLATGAGAVALRSRRRDDGA